MSLLASLFSILLPDGNGSQHTVIHHRHLLADAAARGTITERYIQALVRDAVTIGRGDPQSPPPDGASSQDFDADGGRLTSGDTLRRTHALRT
ncbi:hypothetical protein Hypma_012993 [Hypsizygus marmoreus]|uniref:Uncharacterized protein n=1 Tax=Hypsizygus marmoreus TaxID=39966 RepID=A0A369JK63_HYPMA|nr:hypothetical protein Hypma_012993 [Hypsizygus marmoreus]